MVVGKPGVRERREGGSPTDRATRPRDPDPRPFEGVPRASRRRGPGEDSTGVSAVARQFCDTPREYPC